MCYVEAHGRVNYKLTSIGSTSLVLALALALSGGGRLACYKSVSVAELELVWSPTACAQY